MGELQAARVPRLQSNTMTGSRGSPDSQHRFWTRFSESTRNAVRTKRRLDTSGKFLSYLPDVVVLKRSTRREEHEEQTHIPKRNRRFDIAGVFGNNEFPWICPSW